ncbi:MAG: TonB-dependent receptor, partial [Sulfurimonadaceae bacterium]
TDNDRIEASLQSINGYVMFDSSGADKTNDELSFFGTPYYTHSRDRFYQLAYKHTDVLNDITVQYNLSTFNRSDSFVGSVNEVKVDDKINYLEKSFVRFGASYQQFENKTANNVDIDKSYDATSAFLTNYNTFNGDTTILTESLRYDSYSDFDSSFTGKIGIKQYLYDTFYVSANAGTGYNIPSSFQLYDATYGNLNLSPEETQTYDITLGNETLWVTGFYNKINNLIDYVIIDYTTYAGYYQNVEGESIIQGFEIGYTDYFFEMLGLTAHYTYLKTEDADGKALGRRPKDQVDVNVVYYATENFDLGLNGQYIGERYNFDDKGGAQTGKYTVVNFVSNVKVNDYITVYGKVDNITDEYYQTVDGYATAGRSLYIGLNAKY